MTSDIKLRQKQKQDFYLLLPSAFCLAVQLSLPNLLSFLLSCLLYIHSPNVIPKLKRYLRTHIIFRTSMVFLLFLFFCLQLYSKHPVTLKPRFGSSEETFLNFGLLYHATAEYFHYIWVLSLNSCTLLSINSLSFMELLMTSKDVMVTRIISQFLTSFLSCDCSKAPGHYFDNCFFSPVCRNKSMQES